MARIFISHSSRDSFEALAFRDWLVSEGWGVDDVFLDLHGIGAGSRWKEALARANERCEAVLFLVSPHSLASNECYVEIRMAEDMGKVILPTILPARVPEDVLKIDDARLAAHRERQIVDVSVEPREAAFTVDHEGHRRTVAFHAPTLARIKGRLDQLGISPDSFPWVPGDLDTASPFPGLTGFAQGEAALFFGRAGDIARGFASLRKLRRATLDGGQGSLMVIQAASGAGKSSFLKAGLWPRIVRDPDFMTLAILRPATGILTGDNGIGRQLASFFARNGRLRPAAGIHHALQGAEAQTTLAALIAEATEIGRETQRLANPDAPPPTPVIAVDQAEELFAAGDAEESRRFLSLMAALMGTGGRSPLATPPICIWTIRADSMDTLLHATTAHALGAPELFPLPPIARTSFAEIINGPLAVANRAGMRLTLDPLLSQRLIEASEGADALPLLAYTLRQLVEDNRAGPRATISLGAFESGGGIGGVLRKRLAVAQRTAGADDTSLRTLFVPRLATWDGDATPPGAKRLVADETELLAGNREALRPLAEALVNERLLTRGGDVDGRVTLEVAHEALLRQPPISEWLAADADFLSWRENVERARQLNEVNVGATVFGVPVEQVERWLAERADDMTEPTRAFARETIDYAIIRQQRELEEARREQVRQRAELEAAKAQEEAQRERANSSRRIARRTMVGLIVALLLAFGAGVAGWYAETQRQTAIAQTATAKKAAIRASDEAQKALLAEDRARLEAANARAAETQATAAEMRAGAERDKARITQSGLLSDVAAQRAREGVYTPAVLLALHGLPDRTAGPNSIALDDRPHVAASEHSLYTAIAGLRERHILAGHSGIVEIASFSGDGARIVTASLDGTARIWEATTGRMQATCTGHNGPLVSAAFSPDGMRIVTASADGTARIWNAMTCQSLFTLAGHSDSLGSAAFSPNGSRIVTISADATARIWDTATGSEMGVLRGHTSNIVSFAFNPDGNRIVTASRDRTARVWDVATGREILVLKGHDGWIISAVFSPDGSYLLTASEDRTARLWDAATGNQIDLLSEHEGAVVTAAFSPDGRFILTASADRTARIWSAATRKPVSTLRGHDDWVLVAAFSPDGMRIVTASADNTARLWDRVTGKSIAIMAGHSDGVMNVAFSADGSLIATASLDNTARIWKTTTDNALATLVDHTDNVASAAFSPNGSLIVTTSSDRTARLWDTATGKARTTLAGHGGPVTNASFSLDGTRIVTGSADKTARIWDVATGNELAILAGHDGSVSSAVFSADGKQLATVSTGGFVKIWNVATGSEISVLPLPEGWALGIDFRPDGVRIAIASANNELRLWDATNGKALATFTGHADGVSNASFSFDGAGIITTSRDKSARVWDVATGRSVAHLIGHDGGVLSAMFNMPRQRVVTTSVDGTARVWDSGKGELVATIAGHDDPVTSAAFNPDSTRLVTASSDKTARIWRVFPDTQALVDHAKRIVPRCLTLPELKRFYLPSEPLRWCITGPGLEAEVDSVKWQPKWPYHTPAWRDWLAARDRGEKPELPKE